MAVKSDRLLAPTVKAAMDVLDVEVIDAVADRGYFKIEDIEACERAGITAYVPKPIRGPAVREGLFSKEEWLMMDSGVMALCPVGAGDVGPGAVCGLD